MCHPQLPEHPLVHQGQLEDLRQLNQQRLGQATERPRLQARVLQGRVQLAQIKPEAVAAAGARKQALPYLEAESPRTPVKVPPIQAMGLQKQAMDLTQATPLFVRKIQ
jgi:hypothetical protein